MRLKLIKRKTVISYKQQNFWEVEVVFTKWPSLKVGSALTVMQFSKEKEKGLLQWFSLRCETHLTLINWWISLKFGKYLFSMLRKECSSLKILRRKEVFYFVQRKDLFAIKTFISQQNECWFSSLQIGRYLFLTTSIRLMVGMHFFSSKAGKWLCC